MRRARQVAAVRQLVLDYRHRATEAERLAQPQQPETARTSIVTRSVAGEIASTTDHVVGIRVRARTHIGRKTPVNTLQFEISNELLNCFLFVSFVRISLRRHKEKGRHIRFAALDIRRFGIVAGERYAVAFHTNCGASFRIHCDFDKG